jgi:hypothetical protein
MLFKWDLKHCRFLKTFKKQVMETPWGKLNFLLLSLKPCQQKVMSAQGYYKREQKVFI